MLMDKDTWEYAGDNPKTRAAIMKYRVRKFFWAVFIS